MSALAEETVFTSGFFDQQQKSWKIREVVVLAERLLGSGRKFSIAHLFRLHMIPSEDRSTLAVPGQAPGPCLTDRPAGAMAESQAPQQAGRCRAVPDADHVTNRGYFCP